MRWYERVPLLLAAAALMIGSAAEESNSGQQLLAAGFVLLGAWMATEVAAAFYAKHDPEADDKAVGPDDRKNQ